MQKSSNNTGFWIVIAIAAVGGLGFYVYDNFLKKPITTGKTLGIL